MFNHKSYKLFSIFLLIGLLMVALSQASGGGSVTVKDNVTGLSDLYDYTIDDTADIEKGKNSFFLKGNLLPELSFIKQYLNNYLFLTRDRCNIRTTYKYPPWSKSTFS